MEKLDYKKKFKELYQPKSVPSVVAEEVAIYELRRLWNFCKGYEYNGEILP